MVWMSTRFWARVPTRLRRHSLHVMGACLAGVVIFAEPSRVLCAWCDAAVAAWWQTADASGLPQHRRITLHGRLVDASGLPLKGAKVHALAMQWRPSADPALPVMRLDEIEAVSDARGCFVLRGTGAKLRVVDVLFADGVRLQPERHGGRSDQATGERLVGLCEVMAAAEGQAVVWTEDRPALFTRQRSDAPPQAVGHPASETLAEVSVHVTSTPP